jgi:hypothetical protein
VNVRGNVGVDVANFAGAYLAAMCASAIVFGVQYGIEELMFGWASSVPLAQGLYHCVVVFIVAVSIFTMLALWLVLVPAAVSALLARRLGIDSVFYYMTFGVLSAASLTPVTLWLLPWGADIEFPLTLEEQYISRALRLLAPAISGSVAFWFVDKRLRLQNRNA